MTSAFRVLGVDPGARRIGLALSDEEACIASPHATLQARNAEHAAQMVCDVAREQGVRTVVVGLPLNLDGSDGDAALRARRFAKRLRELTSVEVVLWDERLSSQQADRALGDAGVRGRKRRGLTDRIAAALVLQSYLDARASERTAP